METLQPKLRFPEFIGDWKKKNLGDFTQWSSGGTPSKENQSYWNGNIPWISASTMRGLVYTNSELKLTELGLKKGSRLAKKGELLLLVRGSMLFNKIPIGIAGIDVAFNQDLKSISVIDEVSSSGYILHWFFYSEPKLLNMVTGTGIGAGKLDLKDLKDLKINIPSLPEQTRIADFLSAVDEKLHLLKEKKALLAEYKKGMMQKIFNQELRFKDDNGEDFESWDKKSLGQIGNTFNGLTGKTKEDFGIGKPYIQYKQIFNNSKINIDGCQLVDIDEKDNQNKVQFGDVFFTVSSETQNEIGTASVLLDNVKEMYLNSFCFGYRANSLSELVPEFSRYLFRNEFFRNDIIKLAQGSTRYNMSKVSLMKLIVSIPQAEEQTKIAQFLSAIDDKIGLVGNQIEETVAYKKGLLQQMFI
jgi:type I restriction enzyme S subunit